MSADSDPIQIRLQRSVQTGRMVDLELEYWIGGGPPPPNYRSDQLRLMAAPGGDTWLFARPMRDPAFAPPDLVEKFERVATASEIRHVLGLLSGSAIFSKPQPGPRLGADVLRTEIILRAGNISQQRAFEGAVPDELRPLESAVRQLRGDLERTGSRSVTHLGKPVVPASRSQR